MKYQRMIMRVLAGLSVFCMVAAAASIATAADISIGGGGGMTPDYEGSDDYKFVPIPLAKLAFDNGMFVNLQGLTVKANLIPSQTWRLAPCTIIVARAAVWTTTGLITCKM
jgi:outer membrane scaffolding protein for murein synthesis (MipA/OmpV family)